MRNLLITRYEEKNDTIFSHVRYSDESFVVTFEGIEPLGLEVKEGTYKGYYNFSPKFGVDLYLIDVPNRQGIRIHVGNSVKDTTGCLILGLYRCGDKVYESRKALNSFHAKSKGEELNIIIKNETICKKTSRNSSTALDSDFIGRIRKAIRSGFRPGWKNRGRRKVKWPGINTNTTETIQNVLFVVLCVYDAIMLLVLHTLTM